MTRMTAAAGVIALITGVASTLAGVTLPQLLITFSGGVMVGMLVEAGSRVRARNGGGDSERDRA